MSKKVLVVEDHPDTSQVVTLLLGVEGMTVITADNGEEGLRKAEAERPDLVITDLMMPEMDGLDMIRLLRSRAEFIKLPIIVITAHEDKTSEAIEAGADGVLVKSVDLDTLIDMVNGLLHPSESA